jgi:mannose-6-phosphate isomerase-like protein (cupin superfamily)
MTRFAVANLEEIDELDGEGGQFRPVRHHFGITTFGVNAMTARRDGELLIKEHSESGPHGSEELYIVISGHARFELDGELHETPAGSFVHVGAGVTRMASARDAGTTVLAIGGGAQGKPYEARDWELFAPLFQLYEAGDYDRAADGAQALIANDPTDGEAYYNTACFESRAGRTDAAIAHLQRALALAPGLAELARTDDDLDALRERAEFAEIIGDGTSPE